MASPSIPPPKLSLADLRNPRLYLNSALAAALVLGGALITVAFIGALKLINQLLWHRLPDALGANPRGWYFVVPVCALGGLAVGVGRHHLGEYPVHLEQALESFKTTRAFDYRHIPQAIVLSLISLGFGAALGPEAALVAIIGGVSTWIGQVIAADARLAKVAGSIDSSVSYIGVAGALGALFGTVGAAAVAFDHSDDRPNRLWLIVPGLAAAGAGALVFKVFSTGTGYLNYTYPPYTFNPADLVWTVPVTVIAVAVALCFDALSVGTDRIFGLLGSHRIVQSVIGGLVLGGLALASTLTLFSGHEGIQQMLDAPGATFGFLGAALLAKMTATAVCMRSGWKGGKFFPVMFLGAATGLAAHSIVPALPPLVGLSVAMTVVLGVVLRKPLVALALMLLVFPFELYPFAAASTVLAMVGLRMKQRLRRSQTQ